MATKGANCVTQKKQVLKTLMRWKGFIFIEICLTNPWFGIGKKQVIALLQSQEFHNEDSKQEQNASQTNNLQSFLDNEIVAQV